MATEVYEEPLDIEVEVLEALPPEPGSPAFRAAYPLPVLKRTGHFKTNTFRSVVLENPFLRVTVLPGLGGRIFRIFDKRTNTPVLGEAPRLELCDRGPRGVQSPEGIQWSALDNRLDDLGPVDYQMVEAEDEGSKCGLWMFSLVPGKPLSVHFGLTLLPDAAEMQGEIRVHNRGFEEQAFRPHLKCLLPNFSDPVWGKGWAGLHDPGRGCGLHFQFDPLIWRHVELEPGRIEIGRFPNNGRLAPRQSESWGFSIFPFSGVENLTAVGDELFLGVSGTKLQISSAKVCSSAKLVLLTGSGQTLEAPIDLGPDNVLEMQLPEAVSGVGILDEDRKELLRWEKDKQHSLRASVTVPERPELPIETTYKEAVAGLFNGLDVTPSLEQVADELGLKSAAYTLLGIYKVMQNEYEAADELFENALLYNGEDALTWWLKAAALRLSGRGSQERSELLNARYLAPLDPVLRAESFLSAPDNTKLLEAFKDDAAALIEVACILFDCRMFEDLTRWVHSALQQKETPMLRYILAAALLDSTKLKVEAASEVRLAAAIVIEAPYPWRDTEKRTLSLLRNAFPEDARLQEYWSLWAEGEIGRALEAGAQSDTVWTKSST